MKELSAILLVLFLAACTESVPPCYFKGQPLQAVSAGCLVVSDEKLLLVQMPGAKFSPPGGSVDAAESAQCAAERETFEEAGVAVQAQELAHTFDNGFHLFWCVPVDGTETHVTRPLEITSASWYTSAEFAQLRWRFPGQGVLVAALLTERLADEDDEPRSN